LSRIIDGLTKCDKTIYFYDSENCKINCWINNSTSQWFLNASSSDSSLGTTLASDGWVAFGDVSNQSIRNILTEISKSIGGRFTEQEMYDTLDFFDWKCPYTGKDLRPLIEGNLGGYATDHIYPQNKEWCGLNVKGNLIIVDRAANDKKTQSRRRDIFAELSRSSWKS
jgi:hypothetical protein